MMREETKKAEKASSTRCRHSWKWDCAYTSAFQIPYAMQSVILLAVTGILLVLRGLLCLTSFGLVLMAAAGLCFGITVRKVRKAGKIKKGMKGGGIRMEEVSRWKAEQEDGLPWKEGWSCYYAAVPEGMVYVLPKAVLDTEQKKEWREKHGWTKKQRTKGLAVLACMLAAAALAAASILHAMAVFLAFGIW